MAPRLPKRRLPLRMLLPRRWASDAEAMSIKSATIRGLLRLSGAWLRNPWTRLGKQAVWRRVCIPHLSWRSEEIVCRAVRGTRFRVRPTDFVENRICFFGQWEPAITAVFESTLRPGDVVVDVGANVGFYSVLAGTLVGPSGRVFALEPSPSIRQRLAANLELNGLHNVEVLPFAAWHETGEATLQLMDGNRGGSSLGATWNTTSSETVAMKRLDDMIPREAWRRVRLIKIDVEGAEWAALLGAEQLLREAVDAAVICEVSPDRLASLDANPRQLLEFMGDLGYEGYALDNDYTPEAYIANRPAKPVRLTETPVENCDVLFVRANNRDGLAGDSTPAMVAAGGTAGANRGR
jgi:FkbM family methyltransferase